jgi:hypothetical protein
VRNENQVADGQDGIASFNVVDVAGRNRAWPGAGTGRCNPPRGPTD